MLEKFIERQKSLKTSMDQLVNTREQITAQLNATAGAFQLISELIEEIKTEKSVDNNG